MTRKEIWKDFFKKVIIPVLLTAFLFTGERKYLRKTEKPTISMYGCFAEFLRYQKNVPVADSDKS